MKLLEIVSFHNDKRKWKCVDVEYVFQYPNILSIYTFNSGTEELRLTDHEIQMNKNG